MTTIFQVLITDGDQSVIPAYLVSRIRTLKALYPDHEHRLLRNEEIRRFLREHLPPEILRAYDCVKPYSYKADVARYALLYHLGGWYYDVGVTPICPIRPPSGMKLTAFREIGRKAESSWALGTAIIGAEKGYPVLKIALDLIVAHCRDRFYGTTPLCPTGPVVFGKAACLHDRPEEYWLGDYRQLTPELRRVNSAFVSDEGQIFAFGKRARGGRLDGLGFAGVNDYHAFWVARDVYGEF